MYERYFHRTSALEAMEGRKSIKTDAHKADTLYKTEYGLYEQDCRKDGPALLFVEGICISGKNERKQIDKMKNNQYNILTYNISRDNASEVKL